MPKMLLNTDNECASALLMAPKNAEAFCEKVTLSRDCHLSPIYSVYGSLYYFLGGCGNVLNIYKAATLVNSTTNSTLFVLESDSTVAINATTFLQSQKIFNMQSRIIHNNTLMIIPQSDVPLFFNNQSLASEQQNISLLWRADMVHLDDNVNAKINTLRSRARLASVIPDRLFSSWRGVNSAIAIWCTIATMGGIIIILMVLVAQLRARTTILTATLLALSVGQSTAYGYEFCADMTHGMVTAITIVNYCPIRFEYISIQFNHLSPPTSLSKGLTSWYNDCASAPMNRRCTCFDRARSSLRRYFFTMKMKPLIAEEITICAIKQIFLIPVPVSMLQMDMANCNVTYVLD